MHISLTRTISRFGAFLKRVCVVHYGFVLFLFFIAALTAGGMLFWQHAFRSAPPPEVTVRTVKIKKEEAQALLSDIKTREKIREILRNKTFRNPFTEPPQKQ